MYPRGGGFLGGGVPAKVAYGGMAYFYDVVPCPGKKIGL